MKHPVFENSAYDLVTVGERGQIVIPAPIRKDLGIKAGDKVLVMSGLHGMSAIMVNAKYMSKTLAKMHQSIEAVERKMGKNI